MFSAIRVNFGQGTAKLNAEEGIYGLAETSNEPSMHLGSDDFSSL